MSHVPLSRSVQGRNVVEDSPQRLVMEEKVSRWIGGAALIVPIGAFFMGELPPDRTFDAFGTAVNAWWFAGAFSLSMLWMALERDRIVFDAGAGTVARTVRVARWRAFERPLAEIERVLVTSKTTTQYGEDSTNYFVELQFRDGKKLPINQSGSSSFATSLATRIESFYKP